MSGSAEKHRRPRQRILSDDDDDDQDQRQHTGYSNSDEDEEEEQEDDEEELRKVRQGFIVDDEDDDGEDDVVPQSPKRSRKRREVIDEDLDDDDLELMAENTGIRIQRPEKFKRLKKRRQGLDDEDDDDEYGREPAPSNHDLVSTLFDEPIVEDVDEDRGDDYEDEMDHFIDDDDSEDEADRYNEQKRQQRQHQQQAAPRKPIPQRAPMSSSNQELWNEWHEVFGDGEDYAYALTKENGEEPNYDPKPEAHLKDVFEPGVLADKMLTDLDDVIRLKDVPERMQMRPGIKTDRILTDGEIELEAYWVTTALNDNPMRVAQSTFDSTNVQSILKFMSQELMEVPFIDMHRRDYFTKVDGQHLTRLLSRDDLWFIYDEDLKFRSFMERKEAIGTLLDRLHISDDYLAYSLLRAERLEELTDISDYINLRYSRKIDRSNADANILRRAGSGGLFDPAQREKLSGFIKALGITTQEFGTNLTENSKRFSPDEPTESPEETAQPYVGTGLSSVQRVIMMAMGILTQDMTVDPQVRRAVRTKYEMSACVTVTPTESGAETIDELHPYYPFKRLTLKHVRDFHDGQFLQILQAQSEGLLKVEIKIPDKDTYIQSISEYYVSDSYSDHAKQWNALRAKIVSTALKKHLFGMVERGMVERLKTQAEEWVGKKCQANLEERLNIAPYKVPGTRDEDVLPRVIAISHGPGSVKDAIQVVYVDDKGQFIEHKKLDNLRDRKLQEELLDFLERRRPDVVVVGGFSVATRRLLEQVETVVKEHQESKGDEVPVIMTNDEVAKLYQASKRGVEDHPKAYPITRYCISLARTIQNPINEYAATGADLIGIRLHPLQEFVGPDRLKELLDRALVNVVNDVGVDINDVIGSSYKALMLPYICGLGTRKAHNLLRTIERDHTNGGVDMRCDLVYRKMLTWTIFMNCCSFLRVQTTRGGDVLDRTRIHFEEYNLARKMAADALEIDEDELEEYEEESQHVEELMQENGAERLNELLLEDYALQLERIQKKPRRMTLETIKTELQHPFHDPRKPFEPATPEQIFTMLTGETDQTLREGFIVPALVTKIRPKSAMCRLDCGIDGVLAIHNISDSRIGSIKDELSEGQTLQVKILRLEKDRFFADLTCKESELRQSDVPLRMLPLDRMFDQYEEERSKDQVDPKANQGGFVPRRINHPLFKNITSEAAVKHLATRSRGELVIRPSHRGVDYLIITVKIADGLYKHFDIQEFNKKDDISLGKTLKIDNSAYNDLDELLVSHVEAILDRINTLMKSPKYREDETELRESLESQTRARPENAVYGFTLSRKFPGYFSLIFKLGGGAAIDEWNIKVLPDLYQLKGPSKRDCKDPVAISDNFKDMAKKLGHRKPSLSGSRRPSVQSGTQSHRGRSTSRFPTGDQDGPYSHRGRSTSRFPTDERNGSINHRGRSTPRFPVSEQNGNGSSNHRGRNTSRFPIDGQNGPSDWRGRSTSRFATSDHNGANNHRGRSTSRFATNDQYGPNGRRGSTASTYAPNQPYGSGNHRNRSTSRFRADGYNGPNGSGGNTSTYSKPAYSGYSGASTSSSYQSRPNTSSSYQNGSSTSSSFQAAPSTSYGYQNDASTRGDVGASSPPSHQDAGYSPPSRQDAGAYSPPSRQDAAAYSPPSRQDEGAYSPPALQMEIGGYQPTATTSNPHQPMGSSQSSPPRGGGRLSGGGGDAATDEGGISWGGNSSWGTGSYGSSGGQSGGYGKQGGGGGYGRQEGGYGRQGGGHGRSRSRGRDNGRREDTQSRPYQPQQPQKQQHHQQQQSSQEDSVAWGSGGGYGSNDGGSSWGNNNDRGGGSRYGGGGNQYGGGGNRSRAPLSGRDQSRPRSRSRQR